ncbi:MAG: putative 7-carboxy-7-deazaguanine synthase QueE [Firmicutes bacterium]|nr:putative 7-carboxy-7-deazaguanine synthase QueE [Bacillota bacterium]
MNYKIAEKFISINGEGQKAGELSVFIRFHGCNLSCDYCDTKWANSEDTPCETMTDEEIVSYIISTGIKNVTLTGGEPMIQDNIMFLLEKLASLDDISVEIETNGSIDLSSAAKIKNRPSFTMDYKLSSSKMEKYMNTDNFSFLKKEDTVKFVCGCIADLEKSKYIMDKYSLYGKCALYISPVFGMIDAADIVEFMKENQMNKVKLQLQLHKYIWDPNKRGV